LKMRALTMDEVGIVSGGSAGQPAIERGPGGVVMQRNFNGNPTPTAMDRDLAGGCPILDTCKAILRSDGSDTGYVTSERDGKIYLGDELANDVINGFEINWQKVAADLALIGFGAYGGMGTGARTVISTFGSSVAGWWQYIAGSNK
jgi:hypothetical protein